MFCNEGLAGLWNLLFCLSFFPLRLLALHLDVPTRSSDGNTVFVNWKTDSKDPSTVYLQIICKDLPVPSFLSNRFPVQISDPQPSFKLPPSITEAEDQAGCNLVAFKSPMSHDKSIAQSDTFTTLKVSPETAPVTLTTSVSSTSNSIIFASPTKSLSSSPSIFGPAPTPASSALPTQTSIDTPSQSDNSRPSQSTSVSTSFSRTNTVGPSVLPSPKATSTTPPASPKEQSELANRPSHRGAIIGGVIGGLVLIALLLGLAFLYYRRHRGRLSPSMAYRAADDHNNYSALNDTNRQTEQFRPDLKYNTVHNAAENGTRETEEETALRRKAEIMDDLRFEAAAREGVKA